MRFNPIDGRLRGRAAVEQRKRRLLAEPLCRHCRERGIYRPATVPDHIEPLGFGGADTEDNIQCLCDDCHAIKTAMEDVAHQAASNHPDWLRPSAVPLTILCGPPCSGKTTYIAQRAKPADVVIDVDTIVSTLSPGYVHWTGGLSSQLLNKAIRARNAMLGALARRTAGRAWFIVAAPTNAERQWWKAKLGGELVLLHPGVEECKRRAIQRGTPNAVKGVEAWERASRMPWTQRPKVALEAREIDADGWPLA